ncbi:NrfD/PsrC family molybdoenzyme membrane anchor subunit [Xiamenia xianingshaonis]|uniref:Polysulfide reductase NrfD n=1 Tax=Xiamenia xianingshaonis TaxID=2682776 RepID=A0A9E6MS67_9ACTN|nr:NrfD/PsrC family molybdoenzyme membrane anchor subunit [Xiamenia xianingshaonis]NHM13646.1 hypothetical protein [Xiamenia xianingshaonis]QTU85018.1 polysulfide reductase NrfD [Xiamenia xianingshaonis]
MKHHYWEAPIVLYLFLGGLGGGIFFLSAVFDLIVRPGSGPLFFAPVFFALAALALGCFFLVFELGQPPVFWRVFTTKTAIIKWGAVLLSVAMIFGFVWWVSYLYLLGWDWAGFGRGLAGLRPFLLAVAGLAGFGIMVYTGVMLSTLKAHAFWATPALPVLFTISALSTACAAVALSLGGAVDPSLDAFVDSAVIHGIIHTVDIVLVLAEIVVLLVMVLSFFGAGNVTAKAVATRWVRGKTAPLFWGGMIGCGLVLPFILYTAFAGTTASSLIAPVLVLCGGLLLRYLCVYSDERAPIPGEERFYSRLPKKDAAFLTAWKQGQNRY